MTMHLAAARRAALCGAWIWLFGFATAILAQEPATSKNPPDQSAVTVTGLVQDDAGKPVGGVTVWLTGGSYAKLTVMAEATSDAEGRFSFSVNPDDFFAERRRRPSLLARSADGRIGGVMSFWQEREKAPSEPVTIKLLAGADFRGRVVDASNQPLANVGVRPELLCLKAFDNRWSSPGPFLEVPPELASRIGDTTDAEGRFTLSSFPRGVGFQAEFALSETAAIRVGMNTTGSPTIVVGRLGKVSGMVELPADGEAPKPLKVSLRMDVGRPEAMVKTSDYYVSYRQTVDVDADGKFLFDGVPAGKYAVAADLDSRSGFYSEEVEPFVLAAGASDDGLKVSIRRAVRIQGRVLDQVTKAPIAGVGLYAFCTVGTHRQWVGNATTDAEGKYELHARPGQISLRVQRVPKGYPRPSIRGDEPGREVKSDCTWDDIFLDPAKVLKGVVVDPSGKPVPGAKILAVAQDGHLQNPCATSDGQGEFSLDQLQPNKQVWLHATAGAAATADPVSFTPADVKDPVKLTVAEASACRVRGVAVDEQGGPIAGAGVEIHASWMVSNWGIGFMMEKTTTDADGVFASSALMPGIAYRAVVTADGREKRETAEVKLGPAQNQDCGSLVLRSTQRSVEGTVVDSSRQPVPDAEVFNRGDSPARVATRTDAQGRFRLGGLYSGQVWVFVQKEGCRFAGTRVAAGSNDLTVTLLRCDEPIPASSRPKEPTVEEERAFARQLADKFWTVCKTPDARDRAIRNVEPIDPEKARQWRDALGATKPAAPQAEKPKEPDLAEVAKTDVDEALALVAERDNMDALRQLQSLARQFKDSDAEKSARFAEEALVRARALDQPDRSWAVAELGNLLVELGEAEAGRRVLDEAVQMASGLAATGEHLNARVEVAKSLAPYDADRAMTLLESLKENERDHYRCQVAIAVAKKDPQKAVELIAKTPAWYQNRARKQIAFDLAPRDANQAIAVIEQMSGPPGQDAVRDKAEGLGWLAVAIAPQNKTLACRLIDRALELCMQESESFRFGGSGRCRAAAAIAAQAKYIEYPDMESVAWRVMAARPSESDYWSVQEGMRDLGDAALVLAAVDRQAARQILEALESQGESSSQSDPNGYERHRRLLAWALIDQGRARQMAEEEIAALAANPEADAAASGLFGLFQALSKSPKDRLEYVGQYVGNIWFPGEN